MIKYLDLDSIPFPIKSFLGIKIKLPPFLESILRRLSWWNEKINLPVNSFVTPVIDGLKDKEFKSTSTKRLRKQTNSLSNNIIKYILS